MAEHIVRGTFRADRHGKTDDPVAPILAADRHGCQAFTDLLNRALDKPKEQEREIELTGSDD